MFLHRPSFVDSFCVGGNCEDNFLKKFEVLLSLPMCWTHDLQGHKMNVFNSIRNVSRTA